MGNIIIWVSAVMLFLAGGCMSMSLEKKIDRYRRSHFSDYTKKLSRDLSQEIESLRKLDPEKWYEGDLRQSSLEELSIPEIDSPGDSSETFFATFFDLPKSMDVGIRFSLHNGREEIDILVEPAQAREEKWVRPASGVLSRKVFLNVGSETIVSKEKIDEKAISQKLRLQGEPTLFLKLDLGSDQKHHFSYRISPGGKQFTSSIDLHKENAGWETRLLYYGMHLGYLITLPLDLAVLPLQPILILDQTMPRM